MTRGKLLRHGVEKSLLVGLWRLEQYYVSGIENKTYLIVEAPDLKNVSTVGATFMAEGAASSIKYIPLFTLPEVVDVCKKAASLGYRPPGK